MYTRRGFIGIATASAVYGFHPDFWNAKDPSEWSSAEIEQLTTKSPWAKEVTASGPAERGYDQTSGGSPAPRTQSPRIGIPGIPGIGGGGMGGGGRRSPRSAPMQSFKGTIRWESAKPILEALKAKLPASFENHYVISVSGIPLSGRYGRSEADPDVDRLKGVTFLEARGKRSLQPGVVEQQTSSYGSVLFGFSKEMLALAADDKEILFTTEFGRLNLKAKFVPRDMLYRGELAV